MFQSPDSSRASESLTIRISIWRSSSSSKDRKSTRLNSSHSQISYAVFCLKKKITKIRNRTVLVHAEAPAFQNIALRVADILFIIYDQDTRRRLSSSRSTTLGKPHLPVLLS